MMVILEIETLVQDGSELRGEFFSTAEAAIKYINERGEAWGCQLAYRLFEVGREIPIKAEKIPEHETVVVKEKVVFKLDNKKGKS